MKHRAWFVYGSLGLLWCALAVWQVAEHRRVRLGVETAQHHRATDIATSLAVVIRSQRRFGLVPRERLVGALEELAKSGELLGVALLSAGGEVIAAGGQSIPGDLAHLTPGSSWRDGERFVVASLVELGPDQSRPRGHRRDERRQPSRHDSDADSEPYRQPDDSASTDDEQVPQPPKPGTDSQHHRPQFPARTDSEPFRSQPADAGPRGPTTAFVWSFSQPRPEASEPGDAELDERERRRASWERLRRMHADLRDPEKATELYAKYGLHMMVLLLDDRHAAGLVADDRRFRIFLVAVALLAATGLGLAWRAAGKSSELQLRLERFRAQNRYLRELNLAAAGLAHETRNPLNAVRATVQLTTGDEDLPPVARRRLHGALEEVDRITSRLNEFIDYSRPRDPQLTRVEPLALVADVHRALRTDCEDKEIHFAVDGPALAVEADEAMLRQVLFNLLLNAIQALPRGGHLWVRVVAGPTVALEVVDDGPGVPADAGEDIFRPYVTLSGKGSGLGLAVVTQIALAHGWELTRRDNPGGGSIFSLRGLRVPPPAND